MKAVEKNKYQTYSKKDIKLINIVKKYFSDCTELIDMIQSNYNAYYIDNNYKKNMGFETRSILFENRCQYKCNK
jgi:hypothetical protein